MEWRIPSVTKKEVNIVGVLLIRKNGEMVVV